MHGTRPTQSSGSSYLSVIIAKPLEVVKFRSVLVIDKLFLTFSNSSLTSCPTVDLAQKRRPKNLHHRKYPNQKNIKTAE